MDNIFLTAKEISTILGISTSLAYRIINQLNEELENMGYLVVRGKVNRNYFEKRYFFSSATA